MVDFDEVEVTNDRDSQVYKDAMALAKESGQGYSTINYDDIPFGDMRYHMEIEDVPNLPNVVMPTIVVDPEIIDVESFAAMDILASDIAVPTLSDKTDDFNIPGTVDNLLSKKLSVPSLPSGKDEFDFFDNFGSVDTLLNGHLTDPVIPSAADNFAIVDNFNLTPDAVSFGNV